jgi:hypothetical protein
MDREEFKTIHTSFIDKEREVDLTAPRKKTGLHLSALDAQWMHL